MRVNITRSQFFQEPHYARLRNDNNNNNDDDNRNNRIICEMRNAVFPFSYLLKTPM